MNQASTKLCRYGFTLVEMLTTIAVIGFLFSILIPVLGRARDQSNLIVCRTNLRSLYLGCLLYARDNNTMLPLDKRLDNPHTELIRMLHDRGYIETMNTFFCPSDKNDDSCLSQNNFNSGNISYFYYSFTDRPANRYLSNFFLKNLPWPRILRDSMPPGTWVLSDGWFSNMPTAHQWYKKGVNYVILDGSVHMVKESPREEFK